MQAKPPETKMAFLSVLAATCSVTKACEAIGVARMTVYLWRDADPEFAVAWDHAKRIGAEALEDEAVRRGREGVEETIYYKGIAVDTVQKYSDTLLIFLLNGAMPDKYAHRTKAELTNPDGSLGGMTQEQIAVRLETLRQTALRRKEAADDGSDLV